MLQGRFGNTSGRPYIEGRVVFPRLKLAVQIAPRGEADISFLADTWADRTTIMPCDFFRLGVLESDLQSPGKMNGVGGEGICFNEAAIVTFSEPGVGLHTYQITVLIAKTGPGIMQCPSLLGRDIMNQWDIRLNKSRNTFRATVVSSDDFFKFTKAQPVIVPLAGVPPAAFHD